MEERTTDSTSKLDTTMKDLINDTGCHCGQKAVGRQVNVNLCASHWDWDISAAIMRSSFADVYREKCKELNKELPGQHMVLNKKYIKLNDEIVKCDDCSKDATYLSNGGWKCGDHKHSEHSISAHKMEIYADGIEITSLKTGKIIVRLGKNNEG